MEVLKVASDISSLVLVKLRLFWKSLKGFVLFLCRIWRGLLLSAFFNIESNTYAPTPAKALSSLEPFSVSSNLDAVCLKLGTDCKATIHTAF